MDPKTTGAFISLLRKERHMTQKQLAEQLSVSDKAVSRWETGRGYPDIDSLHALSEMFSVSINELLVGKRITTPVMAQHAEKAITDTYMQARVKARRSRGMIIALAVILAVVLTPSLLILGAVYKEVMGSPTCVIAFDYSSLTLFGNRYVPLELGDAECATADCLVREAQVQGTPFLGKLFFGESVYSVKDCANLDMVYLETEYDRLISRFYCLESKVAEYRSIAQDTPYDVLSAEILTEQWTAYDLTLNEHLTQMLTTASYTIRSETTCDWSHAEGDESIVVYAVQADGPFRKKAGELLRKQGEYFWFDYDDIPVTQDNGDFSDIAAHEIDDRYDADLDVLFSYMFQ